MSRSTHTHTLTRTRTHAHTRQTRRWWGSAGGGAGPPEDVHDVYVCVCTCTCVYLIACVYTVPYGRTAATGDGAVGDAVHARALDGARQWRRASAHPEPVRRAPRTTVVVATANPRGRPPLPPPRTEVFRHRRFFSTAGFFPHQSRRRRHTHTQSVVRLSPLPTKKKKKTSLHRASCGRCVCNHVDRIAATAAPPQGVTAVKRCDATDRALY